MRSWRPTAAAALMVAAATACAGVRRRARQARAMTNCMLSHQAVPGLRSVASASSPPARRISPAGACSAWPSPKGVQGSAAQALEFVGVDFEREAQPPGGLQNPAGLGQIEGAHLAEDVYKWQRTPAGLLPPPALQPGEHLTADSIYVIIGA